MAIRIFFENEHFKTPIIYTFNTLFATLGLNYEIEFYKQANNKEVNADSIIIAAASNLVTQMVRKWVDAQLEQR